MKKGYKIGIGIFLALIIGVAIMSIPTKAGFTFNDIYPYIHWQPADAYDLDGNTVFYENAIGRVEVSPHTLTQINQLPDGSWVWTVDATSKVATQDIDCAFVSPYTPTDFEVLDVYSLRFETALVPEIALYEYWDNDSEEWVISDTDYKPTGEMIEQEVDKWVDIKHKFNRIDNCVGDSTCYEITNINWEQYETKTLRIKMKVYAEDFFVEQETPFYSKGLEVADKKIDFACKRSSDTWADAYQSGAIFYVDPWASWNQSSGTWNGDHSNTQESGGNILSTASTTDYILDLEDNTYDIYRFRANETAGYDSATVLWNEVSGGMGNGTLANPVYSSSVYKLGKSLYTNGDTAATAYVDLPNTAGSYPTNEGTYMFWVYPINSNYDGGSNTFIMDIGGRFSIELNRSATDDRSIIAWYDGAGRSSDPFDLNMNAWNHLVWTWNNTGHFLYLDGTINHTDTLTGDIAYASDDVKIGCDRTGSFGQVEMYIDEIFISNRSLLASEVTAAYNAGAADGTFTSSGFCPDNTLTNYYNWSRMEIGNTTGADALVTVQAAFSNDNTTYGAWSSNLSSIATDLNKSAVCMKWKANFNTASGNSAELSSINVSYYRANLPVINSTHLYSTNDFNFSNGTLISSYVYTLGEQPSITINATRWFVSDELNSTFANNTQIEADNVTKGTTWKVQYNIYDGESWSGWGSNASITIENSAPTTPTTRYPATNISYYYNSSIDLNCSGSTDIDPSDTVNYELWAGLNNLTIRSNSTEGYVLYSFDGGNGTYLFNCRANDNSSTSPWMSGNISIVYNTTKIISITNTYDNVTDGSAVEVFVFNISYNDDVIADIEGGISWNGTTYTSARSNLSSTGKGWYSTISMPFESTDYTVNFDWRFNITLTNGSSESTSYTYTQDIETKEMFYSCNGTNETVWAVMNLSLKDEVNETALNGDIEITWKIWLNNSSPDVNTTFTTNVNDTNQTFICIDAPNDTTKIYRANAQMQYVASGYDYRDYFLYHYDLDNNTDDVVLYLLDINLATGITFHVEDQTDQAYVGYYIYAQRYDIGQGAYRLVAMGKTGDDGTDLIYLRKNDVWYRFIILDDEANVVFTSEPQKIITDDLYFTITGTGTYNEIWEDFQDIGYSLTFNNDTRRFTLTYAATTGAITDGCLNVYSIDVQGRTQYCDQCSTSASATITCDIPSSPNNYYGTFYVKKNPWYDIYTVEVLEYIKTNFQQKIGILGPALTLFTVVAMVGAGIAFGPVGVIIGAIMGIIVMAILKVLIAGYALIILLICAGGFFLAKMRD